MASHNIITRCGKRCMAGGAVKWVDHYQGAGAASVVSLPLDSGQGDDVLIGGDGDDVLDGGPGTDIGLDGEVLIDIP